MAARGPRMRNDLATVRYDDIRTPVATDPDVRSVGAADQLGTSVHLGEGSELTFERARRRLREFGFNESLIRAHYILDESGPVTLPARRFSTAGVTVSPGLDALVHLFVGQEAIAVNAVHTAIGSDLFADLHELGLISVSSEECRAAVRAEPVDAVILCADRVQGRSFDNEHVLNVWNRSSKAFLKMLPTSHCETFLELCCGAGPACLTTGSGAADIAYGIDINPRAIRFAEFNRLLNGLHNARLECGDLFGTMVGTRFDRIVAHPPYVPIVGGRAVFADGGINGEPVSAAIIRQVPQHLTEIGAFYAYLLLSDRRAAPAEWRVRDMLGRGHEDFDVMLLVNREQSPVTHESDANAPVRPSNGAELLIQACIDLRIERILITGLVIRPRQGREAVTLRLAPGEKFGLGRIGNDSAALDR